MEIILKFEDYQRLADLEKNFNLKIKEIEEKSNQRIDELISEGKFIKASACYQAISQYYHTPIDYIFKDIYIEDRLEASSLMSKIQELESLLKKKDSIIDDLIEQVNNKRIKSWRNVW